MDHPLPWLRYVDAEDIDDQAIDFDGMKVRNAAMEKLGEVDGFIVDADSGRPYYIVVNSGGWFKSKHFLVPVGHIRMDDDNDAFVTELSRDRIHRFPGFDKDNFERLSDDDIRRMNDEICSVCTISTISCSPVETRGSQWDRPEYKYPSWWTAEPTHPQRMGDAAFSAGVEYPPSKVAPEVGAPEARRRRREEVRASDVPATDVVGRAQPGDVVGIDTGGEQTHVGETAEDEQQRRKDAEKAARKRE